MAALVGTIVINCALLVAGGAVALCVLGGLCAVLGSPRDDNQ